MERKQLIRILALDRNLIRLSEGGRLLPPDCAACKGLPFSDNLNKLDCKFCIFYKPIAYEQFFNTLRINVSDVKPRRSNITNRFFCPKCIGKDIDKIHEEVYYKKNLNFILDIYEHLPDVNKVKFEDLL